MIDLRHILKAGGYRRSTLTLPALPITATRVDDLARIIVQVPRAWQRWAEERILPAYERHLGQRTTHDAVSDLEAEFDQGEWTVGRLVLQLEPEVSQWALRAEEWHRRRFATILKSATNVDLATVLTPAGESLEEFLARATGLIKNLDAEARNRIANLVWNGVRAETPRRKLAKEIREAVDMSRRRAIIIARDQATKLAAELDQARQEELGFEEYEWQKSGKVHYREEHAARDGKLYRWDKPPYDGHPGWAINCGCKAKAHMALD